MDNTGITLIDVRSEAMDAIKKLKEGSLDVKTASEIRNLLGVVVDTAKTQVEFLKVLPAQIKQEMNTEEIKAIAGTLVDRDAELDLSLSEIKSNENIKI